MNSESQNLPDSSGRTVLNVRLPDCLIADTLLSCVMAVHSWLSLPMGMAKNLSDILLSCNTSHYMCHCTGDFFISANVPKSLGGS
jgi:hypothetical protein